MGVNVPNALPAGEPQREFVFICEKDGKQQEFTLDNLPPEEEGWSFVDRYEKETEAPQTQAPAIDEFTIYRGAVDVTDEIINDESYYILLLSPDLEKADDREVDRINELYDYCVERGYGFACVTASSPKGAEVWLENTGAEYPFYFMDKTTIRTIARGNPCVLLLKGGTILHKTAPSQLPDETQLTQPLDQLDYGRAEVYRPHRRIGFIIVAYLFPMLVLLLTEKTIAMIIGRVKLWRLNRIRRRRAERDALVAFGKIEVTDDSPRDSKSERTVEKPSVEDARSTEEQDADVERTAQSSNGESVRKGRKEKEK